MKKEALFCTIIVGLLGTSVARGATEPKLIFDPGTLAARDSHLAVKVGDRAPDFSLPSIGGRRVSLAEYRGKRNVVLSFVPAAWTPVCSGQWPGYNIAQPVFEQRQAVVLGITTDNVPTLHAWTTNMGGMWFEVLSDFWPHGAAAKKYGILRSDGTTERALFLIDKQGVIRYIDVHDINERPPLDKLLAELDKLK